VEKLPSKNEEPAENGGEPMKFQILSKKHAITKGI
jgi:hypothetical protein